MALFSRKTTAKKAVAKAPKGEKVTDSQVLVPRNLSGILHAPRVTEKAMRVSEKNVYVFEVAKNATKFDVCAAVKAFYGVTPVKVNIVNKIARQYKTTANRRTKTEKGLRKAYVYLKKGDTISLV